MGNGLTRDEVQSFLEQFHLKVRVFGILFRDDRGKNQKTLEELDISPAYRKEVIMNLVVQDYVAGPVADTLNKLGEMWIFGKSVKKREVYIKVQINAYINAPICISFHLAEAPMKYPFK